ncbi:MAG: hypothetical protein ACRC5G_02740 [Cetobacterium sp.]
MAFVNQQFTYTATNNGIPSGTYSSWTITPGVLDTDYEILSGGGTFNFIEIKWLTPNTYEVGVTSSNNCSSLNGTKSNIFVQSLCNNFQLVNNTGANINYHYPSCIGGGQLNGTIVNGGIPVNICTSGGISSIQRDGDNAPLVSIANVTLNLSGTCTS